MLQDLHPKNGNALAKLKSNTKLHFPQTSFMVFLDLRYQCIKLATWIYLKQGLCYSKNLKSFTVTKIICEILYNTTSSYIPIALLQQLHYVPIAVNMTISTDNLLTLGIQNKNTIINYGNMFTYMHEDIQVVFTKVQCSRACPERLSIQLQQFSAGCLKSLIFFLQTIFIM